MRSIAAAALVALAGCAHSPPSRATLVEASGVSIADAQRRAIEQARGVSLWAKTSVVDGKTVDQRLSSSASGVIERYEVIAGGSQGEEIRIRAWVGPYAAAGPLDVQIHVALSAVPGARGIRRALIERGFKIAKSSHSADLIVTGDARARELRGLAPVGLRSQRARMTVSVVRRDGEVVCEAAEEASAIDAFDETAAAKAVEAAGFRVGRRIADRIAATAAGVWGADGGRRSRPRRRETP